MDEIARSLDQAFTDQSERTVEFKALLIKSMTAKISESVRYFMPTESVSNLKDLLESLRGTFLTFTDVLNTVRKSKSEFDKYNVSEASVANYFVDEFKKHQSGL